MNRQLSDSVPHVGVQLGEYHCPDAEITGKKARHAHIPDDTMRRTNRWTEPAGIGHACS